MTKTSDVIVRKSDDGSGSGGVRILRSDEVTIIFRPKTEKRGRVHQPAIYPRIDGGEWEMNVCVYREGEFRRLAMPLRQAKEFLTDELSRVTAALAVQNPRDREKEGKDNT